MLLLLYETFLSASSQDEPKALHSGNYTALFSDSKQVHCDQVL